MQWTIGQDIWIRCAARPGAFSNERLVIIESKQGPVSGFVSETELRGDNNGVTMVRGVIQKVTQDAIEAFINGAFFTTNGLTQISPENAEAA